MCATRLDASNTLPPLACPRPEAPHVSPNVLTPQAVQDTLSLVEAYLKGVADMPHEKPREATSALIPLLFDGLFFYHLSTLEATICLLSADPLSLCVPLGSVGQA